MSTLHQIRHLAITALAPVHIGTGEDLEPTAYVIDGEALFGFSPAAGLRALPEQARAELLGIVQRSPSVEQILKVQAFFFRHRERLLPEAEHAMPVLPTIAEEYRGRVGKVAQREENGRDIINQLRIARTYGDPATRRPILPGSSLKGAMRTALLNERNDGQPLLPSEEALPPNKRSLALQQRLFKYRKFELDPMRLVQIGDAADQTPAETFATEVRYAVNRKRHPVTRDGREIAAQDDKLSQRLECVPPLRPRAFVGQLGLQELGGLTDGEKLPDLDLRWTFEELAGACNAFYRPILARELDELQGRGYLDAAWAEAIRRILAAQEPALVREQAFLLRVGRHSGAESVTLNGVRSIRINMGKDPKTNKTRYESLPEAKTVWLAARDIQARRDLLPFGWILVESAAPGEALAAWPEALGAGLGDFETADAEWSARAMARREALRAEAEKEREREWQRQEQAEQEEREKQAREARLAAMGDEERRVEGLREHLQRDRDAKRREKSGELASNLVLLLKEAEKDWQGPVCVALADLALEIYGYIGWPASKKKADRQALVEAIRARGI